jgi:hypothetical protein
MMIRRFFLLLFVLSLGLPMIAQRGKNAARGYFKNFESETRRISRKNYLYLSASVRGDDQKRVDRYRELVVEQLHDSKKAINRLKPYQEDDVLLREYKDALDLYLKAFEEQFKVADSLNATKFESFENMKRYFEQVEAAELNAIDASYKIKKAEEYFAGKFDVALRRDEEAEEEYRLLDEVTLYARDMTEIFFRVDTHTRAFIEAAAENNTDTLSAIVQAMRGAIKESENQLAEYTQDLENDRLRRDVEYYLEDMAEEVDLNLRALAEDLDNPYLEEKDFKYAKRDLENFTYRMEDYREDFFDGRQYLIEDYLPTN